MKLPPKIKPLLNVEPTAPTERAAVLKSLETMAQINLHAAGIDIGSGEHWVSVPRDRDEQSVRKFGCFTPDLEALADWLTACGVTTVAMESTGVYWMPLFQILESRGFEVKLVNARHLKTVPGRKSDVLDCQWFQQLHTYGLLAGSFHPEAQVRELRIYTRQREGLIQGSSSHVLRMQKALTQMNVQLHRVISDITGVTGLAIIRAIVAGERNPEVLASLKHGGIKSTTAEMIAALTGDYRPEQIFVLKQELHLYEVDRTAVADCDAQIEQCFSRFAPQVEAQSLPLPPRAKGKKASRNAPQFDLRSELYRISGVDFTQIDGLEALTVQTIIAEVGLDPSRFKTVKHFTSWLALCPGSRITGGKVKSSKTRPVVNRAATAFRLAAQALARSQSALGAFYRRMRARLGAPKAITATAHKLARIFYYLWTKREPFVDPGQDFYEQKYQAQTLKKLHKKAREMGYELVPQVDAPARAGA